MKIIERRKSQNAGKVHKMMIHLSVALLEERREVSILL